MLPSAKQHNSHTSKPYRYRGQMSALAYRGNAAQERDGSATPNQC